MLLLAFSMLSYRIMSKQEAISYFGSAANIARLLKISRGAVSLWPDRLPMLRQYQLAKLSGGALRVDDDATAPEQVA